MRSSLKAVAVACFFIGVLVTVNVAIGGDCGRTPIIAPRYQRIAPAVEVVIAPRYQRVVARRQVISRRKVARRQVSYVQAPEPVALERSILRRRADKQCCSGVER